MPAAYPIPPWLQPTDAIGAMSAGGALGQRQAGLAQNFSLASERLEAEERMAERDAQVKEETMRAQHMRESQQMAMEDAYNQARLGIQRSEFELKSQQMARDFANTQKYQDMVNQGVQSGMDQTDAAIKAALTMGPEFANVGQFAALLRAQKTGNQAAKPTFEQYPIGPGGEMQNVLIDQRGTPHFPPREARDPTEMFQNREAVLEARKVLDEFNKNWGDPLLGPAARKRDPEGYQEALQRRNEALRDLARLSPKGPYAGAGGEAPAPGGGQFRVVGKAEVGGTGDADAVKPTVPFSGPESLPPFQAPMGIRGATMGAAPEPAPAPTPAPRLDPRIAPESATPDNYEIKQVEYYNRPDYESIVKGKLNGLSSTELEKLASERAGIHSFPPSMTKAKMVDAIFQSLRESGSDLIF